MLRSLQLTTLLPTLHCLISPGKTLSHNPSAAPPAAVSSGPNGSGNTPLTPFSLVLATLAVVLWGGNAVANRYAIDQLPPVFVGGLRFALGSLFMVGWCWVEGCPLWMDRGRDWWRATVLGFLLFVQIGTFSYGLMYSNSSHASLLVNSYIFWVALYEQFVQRTIQLNGQQIAGLVLAGIGSNLLLLESGAGTASGRDQVTLYGDLILAFSGFSLAIKIIYTKESVRDVEPGTMILWHDVIGTAFFFLWSGAFETIPSAKLTWPTIGGMLYVGLLVSGFCFGANAWLLRRHGASQVSVFSFATPVCGVILGILFRGDQLSIWLLLAGIGVVTGIVMVNATPPTPPPPQSHGENPSAHVEET